jgi:hypothetical protein
MRKTLFLLASILLLSCDVSDTTTTPDLDNTIDNDPISRLIEFGFTSIEATASKSQTAVKASKADINEDAASVVITIQTSTGEALYTNEKIDLVRVGDDILSLPLSFIPGAYDITLFQVLNAAGDAIAMTPKAGSPFSSLVTTTLDYRFSVTE